MNPPVQSPARPRSLTARSRRSVRTPREAKVSDALVTLALSLQASEALSRASALRVLLVDDCPFQQLLTCALLSRWRVMPQIACDGYGAVLLAEEQEFDIVLMDVEMPLMDGLDATARIRQNERRATRAHPVPVVAYTAGDLALHEEKWRHCGMNAVLSKPADHAQMGECLAHWCGSKFASTEALRPSALQRFVQQQV